MEIPNAAQQAGPTGYLLFLIESLLGFSSMVISVEPCFKISFSSFVMQGLQILIDVNSEILINQLVLFANKGFCFFRIHLRQGFLFLVLMIFICHIRYDYI